jgi:energy-coupling factor transporter ATP-binding protein EcfA2
MDLKATAFRVLNYRSIDDSGWISMERVTNLVGRNESGKTSLLKALHKFNPATPDPYSPQREFPRDRFTRQFKNPAEWPVCEVAFNIDPSFREHLRAFLPDPPTKVIGTKYYDGSLKFRYEPEITEAPSSTVELLAAFDAFSGTVRRLTGGTPEQEEQLQKIRPDLLAWATASNEKVAQSRDLKGPQAATLFESIRNEANSKSNPFTAEAIEALLKPLEVLLKQAKASPISLRLDEAVQKVLPIFIYFENYGVLDSAIYLPRFMEDAPQDCDL